jgi:AcrR family transcriptional regulator
MGTKDRKEREKTARREAILESAKAVFADKGLLESTIDEVAERAEVAKGTIYLYFKTKEDMYAGLVEQGLVLLAQRFTDAIDFSRPADENLRRISETYYRFYREEPEYFRLLFFCSHADIRAKVGGDHTGQQGSACLRLVSSVIKKGIDDGLFSKSVDPWKAAAIGWASHNGIILIFEQDPRHATTLNLEIEELLKMNIEILIRALKGAP